MKKIIGILLLSMLLLGGCTLRENSVIEDHAEEAVVNQLEKSTSEEEPLEDESLDEDASDSEDAGADSDSASEEKEEKPESVDTSIKEDSKADGEKQKDPSVKSPAASEDKTAPEDKTKDAVKPSPKPSPKPASTPKPEPEAVKEPELAPKPEPVPEPIVVKEPEKVLVVLPDGTGKDYLSFTAGLKEKLSFEITKEEHESIPENIIIKMTTPPGSYEEGTVIRLLVSSGKPPVEEAADTYDIVFRSEVETEIVRLVNAYRAANGLNALEVKADLSKSARYKSRAMIEHDYFSHDNPQDGNISFGGLMRNVFGYNHYSNFGENLAAQFGSRSATAENLFLQWKNSDGHNKNMLDPNWKYIGLGVAYTSEAGPTFKNYPATLATQHFAR